MDEVVEQRWDILDVDGEPDGAVRRVSGRTDPPAGTTTAAVLERLRAEGWEVASQEGSRFTLRRRRDPFERRYRWVRADEYTEELASAHRAAGLEERRAVREAVQRVRALARRKGTRRDADGRTLVCVPQDGLSDWE